MQAADRDTLSRVSAQSGKAASSVVRVRDVLALPELQAAGVRVVAGYAALDNEVRWVHAGEIDDIATFLQGGELLFTAGTGIDRSDDGLRRYVERLAAVGASALVVELGRGFRRIPGVLTLRAEELGLPVAVLERQVPFAGVMRTVHRMIIGRQYELVERAESIASEFSARPPERRQRRPCRAQAVGARRQSGRARGRRAPGDRVQRRP